MSADPLSIVEDPINGIGECMDAIDSINFDVALNLPGYPNLFMSALLAQINPIIELLGIIENIPELPVELPKLFLNLPSLVLDPFVANFNTKLCAVDETVLGLPIPEIIPSGFPAEYWDDYDCTLGIDIFIGFVELPFVLLRDLLFKPLIEALPFPNIPTFDLDSIVEIVLPAFEAVFPYPPDFTVLTDLVECFSTAVLSVFEGMLGA